MLGNYFSLQAFRSSYKFDSQLRIQSLKRLTDSQRGINMSTRSTARNDYSFLGLLVLMSLYGYIVFRIFQIGILTKSMFYKSVCIGGGVLFGLNFLINAGVTMGLFPTKGLTLPFLSYGGSSLVVFMFLFGVLVNIEKNTERSLS